LAERAAKMPSRLGVFQAALLQTDEINVIAECKRRSPSRGVLRDDYDPVAIATGYAAAGAAAISVLTEPTFFDGSLDHLAAVRAAVGVPLLRKDFVVSEYQLLEAKAAGADAVLLIVAALRPAELKVLHDHARRHGLDVLVECHDQAQLERALRLETPLIGINNRDLRTFETRLETTLRLLEFVPDDRLLVTESGIGSPDDVRKLSEAGVSAYLVGSAFMSAEDPGKELARLFSRG